MLSTVPRFASPTVGFVRKAVDAAVSRAKAEPAGPRHESLTKQADAAHWMLEEFYVSLWAQELGTSGPVSLQRIRKALQ